MTYGRDRGVIERYWGDRGSWTSGAGCVPMYLANGCIQFVVSFVFCKSLCGRVFTLPVNSPSMWAVWKGKWFLCSLFHLLLCVFVQCWRGCERAMCVCIWYVTLFLYLHRVILRSSSDTGSNPYDYYIGICTVPNPELVKKNDDCMVIQKNSTGSAVHGICLGRKSGAQLTDTLSKCPQVVACIPSRLFSSFQGLTLRIRVWSTREILLSLSLHHILHQL